MTDPLAPSELGLTPGQMVLDIGCADGRGTVRIANHGYRVIGVELDADLLASLRSAKPAHSLSVCRGDATALPFGNATVDGIVLIEVLEHIPDTDATLHEIRRVLKPGGRVCIAVPSGYTERLYSRLHPRYLDNAEHIHCFEREALASRLRAAGIHIDHIATHNLGPATAWLFHALLHTDADSTGRVRSRAWIDRLVAGAYWLWRRIPVLNLVLRAIESRVGKSWYFYGVAR